MIKMAHKCSDAQARKLLWGKARDGVDHWGSASVTEGAEKENVPADATTPTATTASTAAIPVSPALADAAATSHQHGAGESKAPAENGAAAAAVPVEGEGGSKTRTGLQPETTPAATAPASARPADGGGAGGGAAATSSAKEGMALSASAQAGILAVRPNEVFLCAPSCGIRQFKTDCALASDTSQRDVYRKSAAPVVCDWLNGINGCLFVFGQTGSGKTHTMFGPDEDSAASLTHDHAVNPQRGLVPRVIAEALAHVESKTAAGADVKLQLSYVEIYGDEVTDLLREGGGVGAWKGVAAKTVLSGRVAMPVHNVAEVEKMLRDADKSKRRAATAMNERSSRAHAVIVLQITQVKRGGQEVASQLCLADLGGSEQLKRSKAEGQQLEEAVKINLGLLSLKQCMEALNRGASHVPYQSSMLTSILQGALGGTSRTCVVVTGSMDPLDTNETMHALRFGEVCGAVENKASLSVNSSAAAVAAMDTQLKELLARIQKEEKWVSFKVEREDLDGKEVVMQSKLVGAEGVREEYEALLHTRSLLLGI